MHDLTELNTSPYRDKTKIAYDLKLYASCQEALESNDPALYVSDMSEKALNEYLLTLEPNVWIDLSYRVVSACLHA